jgi:hypothetical protein
MSLINDALKRAKEAQHGKPWSGTPPVRPIEVREEERDYSWILPVIIVLLIVVAVFFLALSVAKRSVKTIITTPELSATQQVATVAPPLPPPGVIGVAAINNDAPKPTRVQGIFYDSANPWAIISGKTVYVGDSVDGMRVTAITHNGITLTGNGQTNILRLGQQ